MSVKFSWILVQARPRQKEDQDQDQVFSLTASVCSLFSQSNALHFYLRLAVQEDISSSGGRCYSNPCSQLGPFIWMHRDSALPWISSASPDGQLIPQGQETREDVGKLPPASSPQEKAGGERIISSSKFERY